MKQWLFILLTLFFTAVYGQSADTSLWYKHIQDLRKQINLTNIRTSTDTFHFRLWTDKQAIDIWTLNHTTYSGTVTNYAQRYNKKLYRKGVYKIDKVFSNQIPLDSSKARKVFILIDSLSIVAIPTDEKIPGWQQGFDGEEFIIETSTLNQYQFKTYWTPRIFADSLTEAKRIQTLVDRLYKDFKIGDYYRKLKLPPGDYERNGIPGIEIRPTQNNETRRSIMDWF